jgi:hypothetical protein
MVFLLVLGRQPLQSTETAINAAQRLKLEAKGGAHLAAGGESRNQPAKRPVSAAAC